MSPELIELPRRAVACKGWRWMPGMRLQNGYMLKDEDFPTLGDEYGWLPDLEDPATMGCLLALVREAWGVRVDWMTLARVLGEDATEAEALVAALEAAP